MNHDTPETNPFLRSRLDGMWIGAITADDRIAMVQDFSAAQCEQALTVPGLQKTVIRALRARMRRLTRGDT